MFEAVQPFAKQSFALTKILERHQVDYQLAQDFLIQPNRRLIDMQDARAALDGNAIAAIDGNVIRGVDGEKLDLSQNTMHLSLEGAGGLELDIGTIERPDTRRTSLEISRKQLSIQSKEADIAKLSGKSEQIAALIDQLKLETSDSFASDEGRARLARGLVVQFPDMVGLAGEMEALDTGAEFLKGLIEYLSKAQNLAERHVSIGRAEITTLRRDIGKLQAQIDTKRGLAAEKLRTRKERVLATRAFYDRLGVSEALGGLQDVFERISPSSPLNLPDGTVVSGINLSTLSIISTRTPGEGGPSDMRCQHLFAEVFNLALTGDQHEPIVFTEGGRLTYQKNGKVIDRARFAARIDEQNGDLAFHSKVIARLFHCPE